MSKPLHAAAVSIDPDLDPPPHKSASPPGFLWSSLFADSASFNAPSSSPTYLPDGTPVVLAPPSVILKASSTWAGHILCRFLGEPPSPAKFYSDLNRIWGKQGDISVRRFSSGTFLVYVPSAGTRKWILQTGLWSSGTVSFVVSEWSVNPSLAPPSKLTSATTVLTISGIPPQLWSHEAVARIAGGVAKLIPDTRASLPRSSLGTATIRDIVPLGSPLSPSVLVKDSNGDSVLVSIDYGKIPHLFPTCNSYGHQSHRCPSRSASVALTGQQFSSPAAEMDVDRPSSTAAELPKLQQSSSPVKPLPQNPQSQPMFQAKQDSQSNPASSLSKTHSDQVPLVSDNPKSQPMFQAKQDSQSYPSSPSSETHSDQVPPSNSQTDDLTMIDPLVTHVTPTLPCDQTTHQAENANHTSPSADQTKFDFPPSPSHALNLDIDPSSASQSTIVVSQVQLTVASSPTGKREGYRDKRKAKFNAKSSLRCIPVNHQFKPKGVVEKRRKKANNDQVPTDEEVHKCLHELHSDMKDTLL